jgi:hypothetical protein
MYKRIHFIYLHTNYLPDDDFSYMINKWDTKLIQFKLHSEINCTKYKTCHIEWSPEVGFWLSRQWLLARVRKFVLGLGPPNPRNLVRDCLRSHLFDPRMILYSNVMIHIQITQQQLWTLAKDGPDLRRKHLLELHKAAEDREDSTQSSVILEILTREQEQKKWRHINYSTRSQKGGAPIQIRVQSGQTTETYLNICPRDFVWRIRLHATKVNSLTI